MRKILALLLCACAVMSMSTGALAATITENGNQSATTTIQYGVDTAYTVTIPSTVQINPASMSANATVEASDVLLPVGKTLNVTMTGTVERQEDGFDLFAMKDEADARNKLLFYVMTPSGNPINSGSVVLSVNSGNINGSSQAMQFGLYAAPEKAGEYSGQITFTVSIGSQNANAMSFAIQGEAKTAEKGITWREYLAENPGDNLYIVGDELWYANINTDKQYMYKFGPNGDSISNADDEIMEGVDYYCHTMGNVFSYLTDTFTLDGEEMLYHTGMLWYEWVNSPFNTAGFKWVTNEDWKDAWMVINSDNTLYIGINTEIEVWYDDPIDSVEYVLMNPYVVTLNDVQYHLPSGVHTWQEWIRSGEAPAEVYVGANELVEFYDSAENTIFYVTDGNNASAYDDIWGCNYWLDQWTTPPRNYD